MDDISVLITRAQEGDQKAREVLIEKNLGLVHHIVKRFAGRGYDMEDLFQIGTIGLIKAIDKFDLTYEVRFSTYAVPMIAGEIKRFLRDDGLIRVSRTLKENGWKVKQAAQKLANSLGRDPTLEEIAAETGMEREDVVLAMEAGVEVESIYKTIYQSDGNEIQLLDKVAASGVSDGWEDEEKDRLLDHMLLEQLLDGLSETERELIRMRYFEDMTQSEVAKKLGISQVQVSRLEKKILLGMRHKVLC
ncbi:MAG TPA: SigF/SigG family RNA polymerase sporulation sigma factor [Candidatus Eisenbergiella merdipullorum]|uniref:RNA polymerase sigma factor n=1 Tax=Candidatus Eisenbergiella merdipullorum TaxID=2838553 RepID=A0A9D2I6X3_9FIRM|nr:SigF/SigG family RNA polymerase sporulation sigma factor [Candidatus Eisenbergiella merdipullorum]